MKPGFELKNPWVYGENFKQLYTTIVLVIYVWNINLYCGKIHITQRGPF